MIPVRALAGIVLAALVLRLLWAWVVPVVPMSDSHAYDTFARNLVQHGVFGWTADEPFAFWPPGTSFIYAAVYAVFGVDHRAIVVLNLLLSVVIVVCAARVALRWFGPAAALACAAVLAFWPTLVLFTTVLASELPYLALTVAALDVWTQPKGRPLVRAALCGLLLGAAALVRPQALLLPAVYGLGIWAWGGADRRALRALVPFVAVMGLVMALVIAPWSLRNYALYGEPVLISTNGGITLWMGNSPGTTGDYVPIPERLNGLNDRQQSLILGNEARQYILAEPGAFVLRTAKKFVQLYSNESIGVAWNEDGIRAVWGADALWWLKRFTQLSWGLIFITACVGGCVLWRHRGWRMTVLSPVLLTIGFYTAVHSIVVSQDRYHLAFAAHTAMLAGCAVAWLWGKRAPSSASAAGTRSTVSGGGPT